MSTCLYSCVSGEAEKLKSKGIEISVDDDLQINITRDDGGEVKYNNIYNKSEITAMNLSNKLDKLDGFPDITIFSGGHIPKIIEDGSIDIKTTYSVNLRKLYQTLTTNFKNISAIITEFKSGVLQKDGKVKIFTESEKVELVNATTFSQLLAALGTNTENIQKVFNHIFQTINEFGFDAEKFLNTELVQKGSEFKSIEEDENKNYITKSYNVNYYNDLIDKILLLTNSLQNILIVSPENNLKYINAETSDYKITEKHIQTLSDLISYLSDNNKNLSEWIEKIEQIKTTGIDPNAEIELNDLKVINDANSIETQKVNSLNEMITALSNNNNNAFNMISNQSFENFATKDIYPNGCLKIFDKDNNLTEKAGVKTYTDLFSQLNLNNENLNQILKADEIKTMINKLKESECLLIVESDGKIEITKAKIITVEEPPSEEVIDPENPNRKYRVAVDADVQKALERKETIQYYENKVLEVLVWGKDIAATVLCSIGCAIKYLSIAGLQKAGEYSYALLVGTFHAAYYLFTKIGEFTIYIKNGLYYTFKKGDIDDEEPYSTIEDMFLATPPK